MARYKLKPLPMINWISDEFIEEVRKENPQPLNELGQFIFLRTYSRWLQGLERREEWHEVCKRSVSYNMNLAYRHMLKLGLTPNLVKMKEEAQELYRAQYNTKQALSGRTLWVGGAEEGVADLYPTANFNCAYITIRTWKDLGLLFYLLMVGTGVGFKSTPKLARNMGKIKTTTTLVCEEYKSKPAWARKKHTELHLLEYEVDDENPFDPIGEADLYWEREAEIARKKKSVHGIAKIVVGDSKEGWVKALDYYFELLTEDKYSHIHTIIINFDNIRPKGERLKTFGGTASGYESLRDMFVGIDKVLKGTIDPSLDPIEVDDFGYGYVRPIHILDIGNLIGYNVVVGGVRRTAELFLIDQNDWESIWAKYGINGFWTEEHFKQHEKLGELLDKMGVPKPKFFDELGIRYYTVRYKVLDEKTEEFVEKFKEVAGLEKAKEFAEKVGGELVSEEPHNYGRPLHHRRMSNNSIAYTSKPSREMFDLQFMLLRGEGEPCFINLEQAVKRRGLNEDPDNIGLNPCAEIILSSYGLCNLTTVNWVAHVRKGKNGKYYIDIDELVKSQIRSARAALRMTLVDLEIPEFDQVQKTFRLTGCSQTGVKDALDMCGLGEGDEERILELLAKVTHETVEQYARELRIPTPLLDTAVKPEGTLSQLFGGVSSGCHYSHSPYYIRRVRINAHDPLVQVAKACGWTINPEVGTPGETYEEKMKNASTLVIDFPIASGAKRTKYDVSAREQLETYFRFQKKYTAHNTSNTISVKDHEWDEVAQIIWDRWDEFVGVSFIKLDGHTYELAPYEAITEEQYKQMKAKMRPFDVELLHKIERGNDGIEDDLSTMESCEGGACPIR